MGRSTNSQSLGRDEAPRTIRTLVISQHEAVRRQLVAYLGRSPDLEVFGESFSAQAIGGVDPDIVVLDLSQLSCDDLRVAIEAASRIGARLIALASLSDPADEEAVHRAGGVYRLKAAGAGDLAEIVVDLAVSNRPAF